MNASFEDYDSHHGGALSMSGTVSKLTLEGCGFHGNHAQGQVGQAMVMHCACSVTSTFHVSGYSISCSLSSLSALEYGRAAVV